MQLSSKNALKNLSLNFILFCTLGMSMPTLSFSHGEDVKGPHGGMIRMPGEYHVELVETPGSNIFKVYLLDLQFKNPVIEHSKVNIEWVELGKSRVRSKCIPKNDYFECVIEKFKNGPHTEILVESTRFSKTGNAARFVLVPVR